MEKGGRRKIRSKKEEGVRMNEEERKWVWNMSE